MTTSRRDLFTLLAATSVLSACSAPGAKAHDRVSSRPSSTMISTPAPSTTSTPPVPASFTTAPIPSGPITTIPAGPTGHHQVALTIDDGVDPRVVAGYADLCRRTGMRLTFFANGRYESWKQNRDLLIPLVESKQIIIGNHTYSHPDIRRSSISATRLTEEITTNEKVFHDLFGSEFSMKPYFRPPYGFYDRASLAQVRDMGYTAFTCWYGTTGDEQIIAPATIMKNLRTWAMPGRIIIGHANHPAILKDLDAVHALFEQRNLTTVTMADVYPV